MKKYETKRIINVAGRGLIALVTVPNPDRLEINPKIPNKGDTVIVNDKQYRIIGVELMMKLTYPPFVSEEVGLNLVVL